MSGVQQPVPSQGGAAVGPRPRQAVIDMAAYSPPTSGRAGNLRLDFNENTVGIPSWLLEKIRARLDAEHLAVYPEYEQIRPKLARHFGVHENELVLTNGTDEAIQLLVNTYVNAGDRVIVLRPSYAMYRFYAQLAGAQLVEIPYHATDLSFPMEELLQALAWQTRLVLLANPNNPTGTTIPLDQLRALLTAAPQTAILVDEAYYEFSGITALPLIYEFPNLFVSRTFSKAYGLASLRLGCLFSRSSNTAWLRKAQSPYSVNGFAVLAAEVLLEEPGYVEEYARQVKSAREKLCQALTERGIRFFPSQANFVLIQVGDRTRLFCEAMRRRGVLVRDRSYELPGCVRVTVGTPDQVERFIAALDEVWS